MKREKDNCIKVGINKKMVQPHIRHANDSRTAREACRAQIYAGIGVPWIEKMAYRIRKIAEIAQLIRLYADAQ